MMDVSSPGREARRRGVVASLNLVVLGVLGGCRESPPPARPAADGATRVAAAAPPIAPGDPRATGGTPAPGTTEPTATFVPASGMARTIPDVLLRDHRGEPVHFYRDLVAGKVVAINFIFTTCRGICPALGANFADLGRRMKEHLGKDLSLISVSVDPANDTPERLKAWSEKFNPPPGWTLVTGPKPDIDRLLKGLGVFSADKNDHSPFLLVGDDSAGRWSRIQGITAAPLIAEKLDELLHAPRRSEATRSPSPTDAGAGADRTGAYRYFTDVPLVNQDGEEMRLYSDLIRGKVVVIQSFFATCRGSCTPMLATFAKLQDRFGDRLGKDLYLISISVDPTQDTPGRLKDLSSQLRARPGWYFLTGEKENVEFALSKLGLKVDSKEQHWNIFLIGNDATTLWKKVKGLARPDEVMAVVEGVIDDQVPSPDEPEAGPGGANPGPVGGGEP